MGDMDSAVDRAVETLAGSGTPSSPSTPAPSPSVSAPVTPAGASAGPGSGPTPATPSDSARAAIPPDDDDGSTLNSQDWLDLEKRRSILSGARTKERSKLLSSLGLRNETPLETLRPHLALMTSDVVEYHRQLTDSLQRRGLLRPAAAAPPAPAPERSEQPPPQPRAMPQPDLQFSDGRRAYSAEGAADLIDWATDNLRAEWDQMLAARLGPMESTHAAVRGAQMRAEANQVASDVISEASTWAYFEDFREEIANLMQQDKRVTVHSAYNRLLQERLKTEPAKIREQARQATLQEIRSTTRNGGASIVPGQAIVAEKRKGSGGLDDLFEQAVNRALATT